MTKERNEADVAFIEALAELLDRNRLAEIEVRREYGEDDSLDIRISKHAAPPPAPQAAAAPAAPAPAAAAQAAPEPAPAAAPAGQQDPAEHPGAVASPMVGTVYLAPEPGADPFVSVGATVTEGETLLIIEAMKTMNHIPAPRSGTVRRILVNDASPVEFGAPLMIID